jgi:hypothetical protein
MVPPTLKKAGSITDKVFQTDPTKVNTSYTFKTQEEIFALQESLIEELTNSSGGISKALATALLIKY